MCSADPESNFWDPKYITQNPLNLNHFTLNEGRQRAKAVCGEKRRQETKRLTVFRISLFIQPHNTSDITLKYFPSAASQHLYLLWGSKIYQRSSPYPYIKHLCQSIPPLTPVCLIRDLVIFWIVHIQNQNIITSQSQQLGSGWP